LGLRGFADALDFAGADLLAAGFLGAVAGLSEVVATTGAGVSTLIGSATGAGVSTLIGSATGAGVSTLYGTWGVSGVSAGLPNKNSLIFVNIMFSYASIY